MFGAVDLTKNDDFDKYKFSGHGIGYDASGRFSLSDVGGFGKNVIIFGAAMSSSVHANNKEIIFLILGKSPT